MTATDLTVFDERMVGTVRSTHGDLVVAPERGPSLGDGLRRAATRPELHDVLAAAGRGGPATERTLDLAGLRLEVERRPDPWDGFRSRVSRGRVTGIGPGHDGEVVAGFADLLSVSTSGERRMYYRLLVRGESGSAHVVEGVKHLDGPLGQAWRQTTTLYTRVSAVPDSCRLGEDGLGADDQLRRLSERLVALRPVAAGTLRVRPSDLGAQLRSVHGRGACRFALGFVRRVLLPSLGHARG